MAKPTNSNKKAQNKVSLRIVSSKNEKTIGFFNLTDEFCQKAIGVPANKVTQGMLEKIDINDMVSRGNLILTDHTEAKEVNPDEY